MMKWVQAAARARMPGTSSSSTVPDSAASEAEQECRARRPHGRRAPRTRSPVHQ